MEIVEKTMYVCKTNKCQPCKDYGKLVWEHYNSEGVEHPQRKDYECKKTEEKEVVLNGKEIKVFYVGNNIFYNFVSAKMFKTYLKNQMKAITKPVDTFDNSQITMAHFFEEQVGLRFV